MDAGPGSIIPQLLLILLLVAINAFFAGAEMAIVSVNKTKLGILAEEGNTKARSLLKLLEEPSKFLSTIQVGITFAGFFASASAATGLSEPFTRLLTELGVPYSGKISLVFTTLFISYITLVFSELAPKRIALQKAETFAMFAVKPIEIMSTITKPFVKFLSWSTNAIIRIAGYNTNNIEEKVSREEIKSIIDVGKEHGVINENELEMINSIFDFDDTLAKQIMTPRTEVFTINIKLPLEKIVQLVLEEKFSRIPIYEEDIDNIVGILYTKDLFEAMVKSSAQGIDIRTVIRPAYFVPETKIIDELFLELQSTRNHMAILIDEYGGFAGLVTIEDLIEEVMGNIFDEHDETEIDIKKVDSNTYLVNGLLSIDDINERLNLNLESPNSDTIGGFVVDLLGRIPTGKEEKTIEYQNLVFKIEKVDEKRIDRLKIRIRQQGDQQIDSLSDKLADNRMTTSRS